MVVFALLLCVVMPGHKAPEKTDMIEVARMRYKPVDVVPTLGIRG